MTTANMIVSLGFTNMAFPNDRLDFSDYNGTHDIDELLVINCTFTHIADSFMQMLPGNIKQRLVFKHIRNPIDLPSTIFHASLAIEVIEIDTRNIHIMDQNIFLLLVSHLITLIIHAPFEHNLDELLQNRYEWKIKQLSAQTNSAKFHLLAASNFSGAAQLQIIILAGCGIEYIENNTFDNLRNLSELSLNDNNIKRLQTSIFSKFIEDDNVRFLNLTNKAVACDCNFYELISVLNWNWLIDANDSYAISAGQCDRLPSSTDNCTRLQIIRMLNICFARLQYESYAYAKFDIHVNEMNRSLIINSGVERKFRVWIQHFISLTEYNLQYGNTALRCPQQKYINDSIKCYTFNSDFEALPMSSFDGIYYFCINYVSKGVKRMWPLHCLSYDSRQRLINNRDRETDFFMILIGSSIGGIVVALVLIKPVSLLILSAAESQLQDNIKSPRTNTLTLNEPQTGHIIDDEFPDYESINEYECIYEMVER